MFFIKKKLKINIENLGVVPDLRPEEAKKKDYKAEEVFSFAPITWEEKPESNWRKFPIFFQNQSSSCVAQAVAKALGIENYLEEKKFVHYSARDIYTRRMNYPNKGMFFLDAMNIGYKFGATVEQLMPSQGLNETVMNISSDRTPLTEIIAKIVKGGNHLSFFSADIEKIASIIEPAGKPVVLGVRFGPGEWFGEKVPKIISGVNPIYGHGICGTTATLYNGKKAIIIEDSAYYDANKEAVRVITEDWFTSGRIIWAGYYSALNNNGLETKPIHNFTLNLRFGNKNKEVVWLQRCLSFKKCFPVGVDFTGYFGGLTLKGVQLYQILVRLPATGNVGNLTRSKLNKEFRS